MQSRAVKFTVSEIMLLFVFSFLFFLLFVLRVNDFSFKSEYVPQRGVKSGDTLLISFQYPAY